VDPGPSWRVGDPRIVGTPFARIEIDTEVVTVSTG
jgi:hypothetical protein